MIKVYFYLPMVTQLQEILGAGFIVNQLHWGYQNRMI